MITYLFIDLIMSEDELRKEFDPAVPSTKPLEDLMQDIEDMTGCTITVEENE